LGIEVMGSGRGPRFWLNVGSWLGFRLGALKVRENFRKILEIRPGLGDVVI